MRLVAIGISVWLSLVGSSAGAERRVWLYLPVISGAPYICVTRGPSTNRVDGTPVARGITMAREEAAGSRPVETGEATLVIIGVALINNYKYCCLVGH